MECPEAAGNWNQRTQAAHQHKEEGIHQPERGQSGHGFRQLIRRPGQASFQC